MRRVLLATAAALVAIGCEQSNETTEAPSAAATTPPAPAPTLSKPAPEGASVYIISPEDGATVSSPVRVAFGLSGMGVAPAGVDQEGTGHHHLLVDTTLDNYQVPVPTTPQHLHFGGGQTETEVELAPGEHTLQLVLGDYLHIPHDPPIVSPVITITVE